MAHFVELNDSWVNIDTIIKILLPKSIDGSIKPNAIEIHFIDGSFNIYENEDKDNILEAIRE